jgi:hypothetical protein
VWFLNITCNVLTLHSEGVGDLQIESAGVSHQYRIVSFLCIVLLFKLDAVISTLKDRLETMQKGAAEWKAKYNLKTQEEVQALQRQQQMAS